SPLVTIFVSWAARRRGWVIAEEVGAAGPDDKAKERRPPPRVESSILPSRSPLPRRDSTIATRFDHGNPLLVAYPPPHRRRSRRTGALVRRGATRSGR